MGNTVTSAKGALAFSSVKQTIGQGFSGESDTSRKSIDNDLPDTKRDMKKRRQLREEEFKQRKQEREKKTSVLQQQWNDSKEKRRR